VDFADQHGVAVRWNVLGSEEHGEKRYRIVRRGLSPMRTTSSDNSQSLTARSCGVGGRARAAAAKSTSMVKNAIGTERDSPLIGSRILIMLARPADCSLPIRYPALR
jgi:hypothetical protein